MEFLFPPRSFFLLQEILVLHSSRSCCINPCQYTKGGKQIYDLSTKITGNQDEQLFWWQFLEAEIYWEDDINAIEILRDEVWHVFHRHHQTLCFQHVM